MSQEVTLLQDQKQQQQQMEILSVGLQCRNLCWCQLHLLFFLLAVELGLMWHQHQHLQVFLPKKLVFINAAIPSGTSTPAIVAEPLKQALPSPLSKTYVKSPEQPQIVLIPSTVGTPIK